MARKSNQDLYSYVLDYITESIEARESLRDYCKRTMMAYHGEAYVNHHKQRLQNYRGQLKNEQDKADFDKVCGSVPEKRNMVVFNAVETVVSMAMGGPGQFEFKPYDKYMYKDSELIDKMSSAAEYFYDVNKINSLIPQAIRQLSLQGAAYLYLKPRDNEYLKVSLIDAFKMLNDPFRARSNRPRYTGFTQMESWSSIKGSIKKNKTDYILKAVNSDVDIYLSEVTNTLNGEHTGEYINENIEKDIDIFYQQYKRAESKNKAVMPDEKKYKGDDIEVSYLYDLENKMYFEVVNRRFIIVATPSNKMLSKDVKINVATPKGNKEITKKISIDSPIVEIPFIKTGFETYPVTPLFYILDDFDSVCSMETVMYHNLSIMAPINFVGSSYDSEIISKAIQIPGEIIDGTIGQTGVFSKSHDMSAVIAAIQRYEERIKRIMGATDQFELQAMIGNRATASEVSSVNGAVSQRLNQLLANIEDGMSELTQKMFMFWTISSTEKELSFTHNGKYSEVSVEELTGDCIVRSRLKSAIKLEQAEQSRNAMQSIGFLGQNEAINKKTFLGTMIPIAMQGIVSRQQAEEFVNDGYIQVPEMEETDEVPTEDTNGDGIIDMQDLQSMSEEDINDATQTLQASMNPDMLAQLQAQMQAQPMQAQQTNMDMGSGATIAPGTMPNVAGAMAAQQQVM